MIRVGDCVRAPGTGWGHVTDRYRVSCASMAGWWVSWHDGDRWQDRREDECIREAQAMRVRLEFKLADFWIGAFWRRRWGKTDLWICLVPCFPIHLTWGSSEADLRRSDESVSEMP